MATIDRRGVSVDATDPAIAGDPNPGLAIKSPVRAATVGVEIVLSGLQTIDTIALAAGDRVLVKDQSDAKQNGLYNASTGNWQRTIDTTSSDEWTSGLLVLATSGATNAGVMFRLSNADPIVVGTTELAFAVVTTGGGGAGTSIRVQRLITSIASLPVLSTDEILNFDLAAPLTVPLPLASSRAGKALTFKDVAGDIATNNITLTRAGSDTFDGLTSLVLAVNRMSLTLVPTNDGVSSGWMIQ